MANTTSTIAKNAGINILALLAAYLLNKVADKNTGFVDTRNAILATAMQAGQEVLALKQSQMASGTAAPTTDTTAQ